MSLSHALRAAAGVWDPFWADTKLLLLGNGSNGSTTITDSTGTATITVFGDAQISTSEKKYGTGSIKLDGTGDYLTGGSSTNYGFGTNDFTIEYWIYLNSTSGTPTAVDLRGSGGFSDKGFNDYYSSGKPTIYYNPSVNDIAQSTIAVSTGQWTHVAYSRKNSTLKIFVGGSEGYSGTNSTDFGTTQNLRIGYNNQSSYLNGYLDDLRITKGICRYEAAFTPPTAQLPAR